MSGEDSFQLVSTAYCFGGRVQKWKHKSKVLGEACALMTFATYIPEGATKDSPVPVVYWLSGLTCTEENFITKAAAQKYANQLRLALVVPDTSPRGCNIPGEDDSWDFGTGAGFYVNATAEKWKANYNMYSYITEELPAVVGSHIEGIDTSRASIMGHSMGGHGALIIALKNPGKYKSVSAFSPICNPVNCPWGQKAFGGYFNDPSEYPAWDATLLAQNAKQQDWQNPISILIDQGDADSFLGQKQLLPEAFQNAVANSEVKFPLELRFQPNYDHSYYFISTFIEDHLKHHHKFLNA